MLSESNMEDKQYYVDIISGLTERTIKRLWITIILLIVLLVGSNAMWIYYESQWEVVETQVVQDNDNGLNNYIGNDGSIYNGTANDQDEIP